MRVRIGAENREAEKLIPPAQPDGSKIGVNYADAYITVLNKELEEGFRISCKRHGLEITLTIGDRAGAGLMRRLEHGPDARKILQHALQEAARAAGATFHVEDSVIYLELEEKRH